MNLPEFPGSAFLLAEQKVFNRKPWAWMSWNFPAFPWRGFLGVPKSRFRGRMKLIWWAAVSHSEKKIFNKHFQGANSELNSLYFPRKTPWIQKNGRIWKNHLNAMAQVVPLLNVCPLLKLVLPIRCRSWFSGRGWGQQLFSFQSPAVHWVARTWSLNCFSCTNAYTNHLIHWMPPFSLKNPHSSFGSALSLKFALICVLLLRVLETLVPSKNLVLTCKHLRKTFKSFFLGDVGAVEPFETFRCCFGPPSGRNL